ncbi:alpha-L-arabinofuranosidase [Carboxylicivirga linearis]|uniref:non-reducing end alpha-L-arabinofuranosidase n=2 Tax=Carboxylicivirga linearis TaxID=1628157 RepID=A0ABS5JWV6_9BACT|nr:alpha-L-arabinofuranosidase [Carboxylicivirga linearis]
MINPYLFIDNEGEWHCIWSLNEKVEQFALASSSDLYNWGRQYYPYIMEEGPIEKPEIHFNSEKEVYSITWLSEDQAYLSETTDFKTFSEAQKIDTDQRQDNRVSQYINGEKQTGVINKTDWATIQNLIVRYEWMKFKDQENAEKMKDDASRFGYLEELTADISFQPEKSKAISDKLIGVFFEDINYAADGGIYAELIQNRGFEYNLHDKLGRDKSWTHDKAWSVKGEGLTFTIDTVAPIHINNKHFAVLDVQQNGAALINEGFDGIAVKGGEQYNFSVFARSMDEAKYSAKVQLVAKDGTVVGETIIKNIKGNWAKKEAVIKATQTVNDAQLHIIPMQSGKLALDMISLFPKNTFKGRKNGLRKDLAQVVADIHPKFVRFPGGCVAHGDGIGNIYHWKNTIGPLEARKPNRNLWGYHQTAGLGYFEYFQYCEDIGAEPLPVVAAGVPCQNSGDCGHGQQGGIPMCEMDSYVQDVLDLIEWANGDKNTKWGKVRAEAGHPKPFNLKYLGVGNEDLITDIFEERFTMIYNAVKEKYPDIVVIGTVGPFYYGTDYVEGWDLATKLEVPMVDEHYYLPPGWFINNQDYYDRYDRSKPKVYLGEYASHLPNRHMNIETALSEALYLTAVERNADVVEMTSFAPLLAKHGHTQWNPDLIYFNNTEIHPTVDYYVQKLFGQNSGDEYIPNQINLSDSNTKAQKRVGVSMVKDSQTGDYIIKMANLLPIEVAANIDLNQFISEEAEVQINVLKGAPDDRKAVPSEETMTVKPDAVYSMPAYSFTVIRIPAQKK